MDPVLQNGCTIDYQKGKRGRDRIDFSATTGISARAVPEYDRVDAAQYYPLAWEALRNGRIAQGVDVANAYATNNLINLLKSNVLMYQIISWL